MLANYVKCNSIIIIQNTKTLSGELSFQYKWQWPKEISTVKSKDILDSLTPLLLEYGKDTPVDIYQRINIKSFTKKNRGIYEKLGLKSLLFTPIFIGNQRFGSMILISDDLNFEYTRPQIQISLTVSILIGLALKNKSNSIFLFNLMDAISTLKIGIFVIQPDDHNVERVLYYNPYFLSIMHEIASSKDEKMGFLEFLQKNKMEKLRDLFILRRRGITNIPNHYNFRFEARNNPRNMQLFIFTSVLNDRNTTYGFVVDQEPDKNVKSANEVWEELQSQLK
jgi:hypothetical protein